MVDRAFVEAVKCFVEDQSGVALELELERVAARVLTIMGVESATAEQDEVGWLVDSLFHARHSIKISLRCF